VRRTRLGADADAQALGVRPYSSSDDFRDETIYHGQYRQWLKLMLHGQPGEGGAGNGA